MESEHPICSTEQTQVMCTEVGRNKKKCSGGGAGHIGVQDKGFYGSSREARKRRQSVSLRTKRETQAERQKNANYFFKSIRSRSQSVPVKNRFVPLFGTMFEKVLLRASADFLI